MTQKRTEVELFRGSPYISFILKIKVIFLAIILCSCSVFSPQVEQRTDSQDCFQNYSIDMTPSQVADLLNLPLFTLINLPDEVDSSPNVRPDVLLENERQSCGIAITYVNSEDKTIQEILIRVHRDASSTTQNPSIQNCVSYADSDFPFQSSCVGTVSNSEDLFRMIILTRYPEEMTREMAEQLIPN